jgi:FlaA1/EpsC-like NDP-sugar epimerase
VKSDAVRTIVRASELQHGQCFVPRIGAAGIEELAKAVYPGAEVRDVGLRSLEKLHEDLVGADERVIATFGGYILANDGDTGISYTSDKAPRLDASEDIRAMIKEAM